MARRLTGGKVYHAITSGAIIGLFIAIALFIFGIMGFYSLGSTIVGLIITAIIVCLSLISTLPWVKRIEDGKIKRLSTMFLCFIAVCALLWIVCVWMTIILNNRANAGEATDSEMTTLLLLIKIVVIISTQLMTASYIGNLIIRFNKSMIIFQIITVLSCLFIDFYIVYLFSCIQILPNIHIADSITFLGNKLVITLLILSVIFVAVSNLVIRAQDNRRMRTATENMIDSEAEQNKEQKEESIDEKLSKLKELFDKNLITEQEYEEKRKNLLNNL